MWFITHSFWYNLYFLDLLSQVSYPVGNVPIHQSGMYSLDDLPKTAVRSFSQSSCVMSMDFHPVQQSVLLGTNFTISFNILSLLMLLYQCLFCILLDSWQQCWRHCHLGCWYTRSPSPQTFQSLGHQFVFNAHAGLYIILIGRCACLYK